MESTTDIRPGQVVYSLSGRDKNRVFMVLEVVDEQYLLLTDGDLRPLERPKKKKVKHVQWTRTILEFQRSSPDFHDCRIRKMLAPYRKEGGCDGKRRRH